MSKHKKIATTKYGKLISKPEFKLPTYLNFNELLIKDPKRLPKWIEVARNTRSATEWRFTMSAKAILTGHKPAKFFKQILSSPDWDVDEKMGHPYFFSTGVSDKIYFDSGHVKEKNGVRFEPFIIKRSFGGIFPEHFELVQDYVLYHNATFISSIGQWQFIDDDGATHVVARKISTDNGEVIECHAIHLRDYLAAHDAVLVRYHDNRRFIKDRVTESGVVADIVEKKARFVLTCGNLDLASASGNRGFSRLLGKDLIWICQ